VNRIQVVYGEFTQVDLTCRRCGGKGRDPVATQSACIYCGGDTIVLPGRPYTYEVAETVKLFQILMTPTANRGGQRGTVVSLTSDYGGPAREAFPIPPDTMECPGCGRPDTPRKLVACAPCWRRVPGQLKADLVAAQAVKGTFARMRVIGEMRNWLKARPPADGS
jgi:hypothetical protein